MADLMDLLAHASVVDMTNTAWASSVSTDGCEIVVQNGIPYRICPPGFWEGLWDPTWAFIEWTFPAVWICLVVFCFFAAPAYLGHIKAKKGRVREEDSAPVFGVAVVFGMFGFLWAAYVALALVGGVWYGIYRLSTKTTTAAQQVAKRKAEARVRADRERQKQLRREAQEWSTLAKTIRDQPEYAEAARAAARAKEAQADEIVPGRR